eukprot:TRINITY_DN85_c0_g1_i5.p1 TRINITY_DN85_c0_g1~~TRINITY_DN85_c0_g1_i5.p1  ORF type:complete len:252 (-),score=82.82 TRINITY_DN85_c0_g1_i5:220-975(-)
MPSPFSFAFPVRLQPPEEGESAMVEAKKSKNPQLIRGVERFSRSATYHRRGLWAIKAKNGGKFPSHAKKEKVVEEKQGREPRFYPADDAPVKNQKGKALRPTKLRASITPGTVLILLVGRFKGKRVVFLKQLPSGLLLVTGPYKINGVPLRRVDQSYIIATSTKVDVSGVDVAKFDDAYFKREEEKDSKGEGDFFESEAPEKKEIPAEKKGDQKAVDEKLLVLVQEQPLLKEYLATRFSLRSGQKPHELKF